MNDPLSMHFALRDSHYGPIWEVSFPEPDMVAILNEFNNGIKYTFNGFTATEADIQSATEADIRSALSKPSMMDIYTFNIAGRTRSFRLVVPANGA